jgi:hypothetical protein
MRRVNAQERQSEAVAREIIEKLLPDPASRAHGLHILAHSIEFAHRLHDRRWAITLCPGGEEAVRLTVGMIFVWNISERTRDEITITVDGISQEPEAIQGYLHPKDIRALQAVKCVPAERVDNAPGFRSAPEAVWCQFKTKDFQYAWPLVKVSHERLLTYLAHDTNLNPATKGAHSPGVLKYLRSSLDRHVPNPGFSS